jgi:hypothetical protein
MGFGGLGFTSLTIGVVITLAVSDGRMIRVVSADTNTFLVVSAGTITDCACATLPQNMLIRNAPAILFILLLKMFPRLKQLNYKFICNYAADT